MWNHLEDCHVEEYRSLKCETDGSKTNEKRRPTLKQSLAGSQPFSRSSDRWKKRTECMTYFIAKDCHPYDTVNDIGFCKMLNVFEPRYTPPDRKMLTNHYTCTCILELYDKERAKMKAKVSSDAPIGLSYRYSDNR